MIAQICLVVFLGSVLIQGSPLLVTDQDIRDWNRAVDIIHKALASEGRHVPISQNTDKKVILKGIFDSTFLAGAVVKAPVAVPTNIASMGVQEFWKWLSTAFQQLLTPRIKRKLPQ